VKTDLVQNYTHTEWLQDLKLVSHLRWTHVLRRNSTPIGDLDDAPPQILCVLHRSVCLLLRKPQFVARGASVQVEAMLHMEAGARCRRRRLLWSICAMLCVSLSGISSCEITFYPNTVRTQLGVMQMVSAYIANESL